MITTERNRAHLLQQMRSGMTQRAGKHTKKKPRRDAQDIEEAALDGESTATNWSLRDSASLEHSYRELFSQSERVGFAEEALKQADKAEPRRKS